MSNLINKVKDALHSDKKDNAATDNPHSTNAGPHGSNMTNSADPRVDSDRDNLHSQGQHGAGAYGNNPATHSGIGGPGHATHGHDNVGQTGYGSTGAGYGGAGNQENVKVGPHSSGLANRADPRVDSDLDGGRNLGGAGGYGSNTHGSSGIGGASHGGSGIGGVSHGAPAHQSTTTAGPHSSNLANKIDPRVDSDLDGGRNVGGAGYGSNTHGSSGIGGASHGGYGGPGNPQSGSAGPHGSNFANSADPRVDSDLDGGRHAGLGSSGVGHTSHTGVPAGGLGQGHQGQHAGVHEQGQYGSAQHQGQHAGAGYGSSATPGSGDAKKTAGPYNSDLMNKLDPRVDSDMDGSKTFGGNKTHQ